MFELPTVVAPVAPVAPAAAVNLYAVAGAVLGLALRTLIPWLVRVKTGAAKFDATYLLNTIYGAAGTVVAGQYLLPAVAPGTDPWTVFGGAVLAAWGLQSLAAHLVKAPVALQAAGKPAPTTGTVETRVVSFESHSEPIPTALTPAQVQAQPIKPAAKPRPSIDLKEQP